VVGSRADTGRIWARALLTALVTTAIAGAGQLGFAYGLGVVRWDQQFVAGSENLWREQLTWAAFIAAAGVIAGAVAGVSSLRRHGLQPHFGSWIGVSLASAVGGGLTVLLVALPARGADLPQTTDSALEAGLAAGLGTVMGIFAALAVLCARLVAGNVYLTIAWVWAVALVSAVGVVAGSDPLTGQGLGVLALPPGTRAEPAVATGMLIGIAAVVGALMAAYGRWLGEQGVPVAVSGVAGPAVLAAAYLVAGPGTSGYVGALLGVVAGAGASVAVAVVRQARPAAEGPPADRPLAADVTAARPAPEPWSSQPTEPWSSQPTESWSSQPEPWSSQPTEPISVPSTADLWTPRTPEPWSTPAPVEPPPVAPVRVTARAKAKPPPPPPPPPPPAPPPPKAQPQPKPPPPAKPAKPPKPPKAAKQAKVKPEPVPSPRDADYESWLTALSSESQSDDPLLAKPTKRRPGPKAE